MHEREEIAMQSERDDLPERLSLTALAPPRLVGASVYRERAEQLHKMAQNETDPTLRGNLMMLAARYAELGGFVL
jgi:hypothetical protein